MRVSGSDAKPSVLGSRPGDIRDSVADIMHVEGIGYSPKNTMEGGLREMIELFSDRKTF